MQMLSSMSKSGLPDVVSSKNTPASKIGRLKLEADSPSPQKNPSFPNEVSPRSADSKPVSIRRSPKNSTTSDKQSRPMKVSELQLQLTAVQEELKKAKGKLAFEEKEKTRVLEELGDAKKAVGEMSEKLAETILAQRKAEENSELDKFRANELEQLAIEDARKREKENKELEDIQNQHAIDVAALFSARVALQKANHELTMATEAKNTALHRADDAMKVAEMNAEKVEILSGEINRLQYLLDTKLENKQIKELGSDVEVFKHELEKAKLAEEKLVEMEALVEGLKIELLDTRRAESDAINLADDWKTKAELLESYLDEVKQSERLLQNSLASCTKKLDEAKSMLDDEESEVISLMGKVEALELEVTRHKNDHEKSDSQLYLTNQELLDLEKTVDVLKSELLRGEDEKTQALNNEKIATSNLEILTQEKDKLSIELEIAKEDSEKAKQAMEGLVSALHEVSAESRYIKEGLFVKQAEIDNATADVDELKLALKNTQKNYEVMLDEAKNEILCLKMALDKSETESKDLRGEWNAEEINLSNTMKTDDQVISVLLERDKAVETLERNKSEVKAVEEEVNKLHDNLRRAESELFAANNATEEAKAENRRLKERLLDKENELQSITQENDDLRVRDIAASGKIEELSESLAKLSSKTEKDGHTTGNAGYGENGKLYIRDKLFKIMEFMEDKVDGIDTENSETTLEEHHEELKEALQLEKERNREQIKPKICESETFDKLASEMEHYTESIEDELKAQTERNNLEQMNVGSAQGIISLNKHQELQKKKKDLLHKFGSLLKKKNSPK